MMVTIISRAIPQNRVLGYVGRNSLYFVGLNGFIFYLQKHLIFDGPGGSTGVLLVAFLLSLAGIAVCAPLVHALGFLWSGGRSRLLTMAGRPI